MKPIHKARKQVSHGSSPLMLALKYPDISIHHQLWTWVPLGLFPKGTQLENLQRELTFKLFKTIFADP
jgi:hypothetical protein